MNQKKLNRLAKILEDNFKDNETEFKFLLKYRIKPNQIHNEENNSQKDHPITGEAKG